MLEITKEICKAVAMCVFFVTAFGAIAFMQFHSEPAKCDCKCCTDGACHTPKPSPAKPVAPDTGEKPPLGSKGPTE